MVRFAAVVVGAGMLVWLAARADSASAQATAWGTGIDLAVGLAFLAAGALSMGATRQRALIAGIGTAWLLGSVVPQLRPLHQGLLVVFLLAAPDGRLRGRISWLLAVLAGPVAVGVVPQIWTAVLLAVTAVACRKRWYPAMAAGSVAAALAVAWSASRLQQSFDPELALLTYEAALLIVAAAFPVAAWAAVRDRRRLTDEVLSGTTLTGLDGIAAVLAQAVDDPGLKVYRWLDSSGFVDAEGRAVRSGTADRSWLAVEDAGGPVAVVEHDAPALLDPLTARAVETAVRLAVTNLRLREEQLVRLRELEAARARVIAASDLQRAEVAVDLRQHVAVLLRGAQEDLMVARSQVTAPGAGVALNLVDASLSDAIRELGDLVAGIPPARLGDGMLRTALEALAARTPLETELRYDDGAAGAPAVEAALFYVCSEALANVAKHARASRIGIDVRRLDDGLQLIVTDNGRGGADPSGPGLTGLADRLAAHGGRLRVDSPPGAGTTMTATVRR